MASTVAPKFYQTSDQAKWDAMMDEICPIKTEERKARMKALGEFWKANKDQFQGPNVGYVDTGR